MQVPNYVTIYLTKYWQLCFTHVLQSQISVTWYVGEQRSDWVSESELWLTVTVSDTDWPPSLTVTVTDSDRSIPRTATALKRPHTIYVLTSVAYQSSLLMYCLLCALFQALILLWTNETGELSIRGHAVSCPVARNEEKYPVSVTKAR